MTMSVMFKTKQFWKQPNCFNIHTTVKILESVQKFIFDLIMSVSFDTKQS